MEIFCILNLDCTVGHDATIGDYTTLYPSVNLSGCTDIEGETEIGTGSHIIQGIKIGKQRWYWELGTIVIPGYTKWCTAVGNPAKVIKRQYEVFENGCEKHYIFCNTIPFFN